MKFLSIFVFLVVINFSFDLTAAEVINVELSPTTQTALATLKQFEVDYFTETGNVLENNLIGIQTTMISNTITSVVFNIFQEKPVVNMYDCTENCVRSQANLEWNFTPALRLLSLNDFKRALNESLVIYKEFRPINTIVETKAWHNRRNIELKLTWQEGDNKGVFRVNCHYHGPNEFDCHAHSRPDPKEPIWNNKGS